MQLKSDWEWRFMLHQETLPKYLHILLTVVATVHIAKSTE